MKFPCKECICLPVCKERYNEGFHNGAIAARAQLTNNCSLLLDWVNYNVNLYIDFSMPLHRFYRR